MRQHILFITSTNLASNPRCRKEIDLAINMGYQVTYIAFDLPNWTWEKEIAIRKDLLDVEQIYVPAGRQPLFKWAISAMGEFMLRKAHRFITSASLISFATNRRSLLLLWRLKKLKIKPSLIIAHNPAAFFPAWHFSRSRDIPFAIDVEDYHAGEGNDKILNLLNIQLQKKILPFADYISFASPLIQEKIVADIAPQNLKSEIVINNVFSETEFIPPVAGAADAAKIKMVWFSQNIDSGRGLEEMLPVIEGMQDFFELTLIGNIREQFYKNYLEGKKYIRTMLPLSQAALNNTLADFDIGLALENSLDNENREICLTNKIWSYFQAGLFIIASATRAQQNFLKQFPAHGAVVNLHSVQNIKAILTRVYQDRDLISSQKLNRYGYAKAYCWEKEAEHLKTKWKEIII